jgi:sodium/potassium/calcium exchanger 6
LGIASAVLAPVLLAGVWDSKDGEPFGTSITEYLFGGSFGVVLGILAFFTTESERPPHERWLFIWVAGGFIMSIVWFYLIATELVAALVALGVILEIDSAFLGLTLLAWGNSIGDLMSNLAISLNSGDGVQIAISGCYAGPMFNTLAGLGLSFMLATWKTFPNVLVLRHDNSLFYTIGFLFLSLLWALLVLPASGMSPNKILGAGLLLLYTTFLSLQLASFLGLISFGGVDLDSNSGFLGIQIL